MLVKILVKLFIGIVDTELLKGVPLEYFKPKNVQHSNTVALETHPTYYPYKASDNILVLNTYTASHDIM